MQRSIAALVGAAALTLLSGCATQGLFGFIATTQYVEREMQEADERSRNNLRTVNERVSALDEEVDGLKSQSDQVAALISEVEETQAATEELQAMAKQVRTRLDTLPEETIRELARILEEYLAEQEAGEASE